MPTHSSPISGPHTYSEASRSLLWATTSSHMSAQHRIHIISLGIVHSITHSEFFIPSHTHTHPLVSSSRQGPCHSHLLSPLWYPSKVCAKELNYSEFDWNHSFFTAENSEGLVSPSTSNAHTYNLVNTWDKSWQHVVNHSLTVANPAQQWIWVMQQDRIHAQ